MIFKIWQPERIQNMAPFSKFQNADLGKNNSKVVAVRASSMENSATFPTIILANKYLNVISVCFHLYYTNIIFPGICPREKLSLSLEISQKSEKLSNVECEGIINIFNLTNIWL